MEGRSLKTMMTYVRFDGRQVTKILIHLVRVEGLNVTLVRVDNITLVILMHQSHSCSGGKLVSKTQCT